MVLLLGFVSCGPRIPRAKSRDRIRLGVVRMRVFLFIARGASACIAAMMACVTSCRSVATSTLSLSLSLALSLSLSL
jgi:hypothetical protein